jgi:hypothetical protein
MPLWGKDATVGQGWEDSSIIWQLARAIASSEGIQVQLSAKVPSSNNGIYSKIKHASASLPVYKRKH